MSLHKNCGWWKNSDCIFEFSVKSYVTNTINLSCAKILLPSVIGSLSHCFSEILRGFYETSTVVISIPSEQGVFQYDTHAKYYFCNNCYRKSDNFLNLTRTQRTTVYCYTKRLTTTGYILDNMRTRRKTCWGQTASNWRRALAVQATVGPSKLLRIHEHRLSMDVSELVS